MNKTLGKSQPIVSAHANIGADSKLLALADELLKKEDFEGAVKLLKPMAVKRQDSPSSLLLKLAEAMMKSDKTAAALPILDRAHRQDPNNPDCLFLYSRALINCRLIDRALPLLTQGLAKYPESFKLHWTLADYYEMAERSDLAIPHFEKALKNTTNAYQKAVLTLKLGDCHKYLNNLEKAKENLSSIKEPPALQESAAIASFALYSDGPDSPRWQEQLKIARHSDDTKNRNWALLELAKAHDRLKNYDEAFELCRQAWEPLPVKVHNSETLRAENAARRRIFTPDLYAATKGKLTQDEQIILICGMPRTGTTLLEQILGAHSKVAAFGETTRFTRLADNFLKTAMAMPDPRPEIMKYIDRGDFMKWAKDNLQFLRSTGGTNWDFAVEKTPMNYEAAGYMHFLHRGARFIFCRRHTADSFISSYQNQLSQFHDYVMHQESYAERFLEKERLCDYWKTCFPEQILDIKYEDLSMHPEATVRSLLEFIGLPWEDQTMRFFERKSTVRTFSTQQVRQSVYTSSVDRWQNYEKHLAPLFNKLESQGFTYR
jgi:tetratricopeptide (TPR) repeat protein